MQEGWRYYNHAMIPTVAPHETVEEPKLSIGNSRGAFCTLDRRF